MDIREKTIKYIGKALQRKRLHSIEKAMAFINSQFYHDLIEANEFDTLLSIYCRSLGLEYALLCEGLDNWRYDTKENNKEWNYKQWNRYLKDWKNVPPFPDKKPKDKVKTFIQELNER